MQYVKCSEDENIPAKISKSNRQKEGLEANPSIEVVKRRVVSISIARFSDGEPCILRVELSEVTNLLQVALHVDEHSLHWGSYWTQKPW